MPASINRAILGCSSGQDLSFRLEAPQYFIGIGAAFEDFDGDCSRTDVRASADKPAHPAAANFAYDFVGAEPLPDALSKSWSRVVRKLFAKASTLSSGIREGTRLPGAGLCHRGRRGRGMLFVPFRLAIPNARQRTAFTCCQRCGVIELVGLTTFVCSELALQKSLRAYPFTLIVAGYFQQLANLIDSQAAEKAELDDPPLSRIELFKLG